MACVLGIETSCDETGVALYDSEHGLLCHRLHSQVATHAPYGGVVPELASRDHIHRLIPLVDEVLAEAQKQPADIDAIAYTRGPGLIGALFVGSAFAKSLAMSWGIPSIGVHHMEGHLMASMLAPSPPEYPFIALLVSGGHTQLIHVLSFGQYQLLGETLDDAAGEAFDKTAKLLGLGYPGGPLLAQLATQGQASRFKFPRPLCDRPGLDFSFSGLKTFTRQTLERSQQTAKDKADIAAAFQEAVVDTLMFKCQRAMKQLGQTRLVIAGGVGANLSLRDKLKHLAATEGFHIHYPKLEFCTDNGAMIAIAGMMRLMQHQTDAHLSIEPQARWPLACPI